MPIGVPSAICPNPEKMELPRIKEDIPKYRKWISPTSAQIWDTFLATELDAYLSVPEGANEWAMEEVFQGDNQGLSDATEVSGGQNAELADMFAAEQAPCQVWST